jgi:hypothetical protein
MSVYTAITSFVPEVYAYIGANLPAPAEKAVARSGAAPMPSTSGARSLQA